MGRTRKGIGERIRGILDKLNHEKILPDRAEVHPVKTIDAEGITQRVESGNQLVAKKIRRIKKIKKKIHDYSQGRRQVVATSRFWKLSHIHKNTIKSQSEAALRLMEEQTK